MKYIMIRADIGSYKRNFPIIFPDTLIHSDIAELMIKELTKPDYRFDNVEVVSAGRFNNLLCDYTIGESTTLKVKAREEDAEIINMYGYLHGVET